MWHVRRKIACAYSLNWYHVTHPASIFETLCRGAPERAVIPVAFWLLHPFSVFEELLRNGETDVYFSCRCVTCSSLWDFAKLYKLGLNSTPFFLWIFEVYMPSVPISPHWPSFILFLISQPIPWLAKPNTNFCTLFSICTAFSSSAFCQGLGPRASPASLVSWKRIHNCSSGMILRVIWQGWYLLKTVITHRSPGRGWSEWRIIGAFFLTRTFGDFLVLSVRFFYLCTYFVLWSYSDWNEHNLTQSRLLQMGSLCQLFDWVLAINFPKIRLE